MKRVVFSGSVKNYPAIKPWAELLKRRNIDVYLPSMKIDPKDFAQLTPTRQLELKREFMLEHNLQIDRADILFLFNPGGYVGNSVTLEIGYAMGRKKLIYALHFDNEFGREGAYAGHCSTPSELLAVLKD